MPAHSTRSARGLPDDVCHHHPGADYRRLCQPRHLQGLHALPHGLADPGHLPLLPHDRHPEGILFKWGVLDFAGGIVVHNTAAGLAALASILYIGKRRTVFEIPPTTFR